MGTLKVFKKRWITLKNAWLPYILCYEIEVASLFNMWLVSGCEQKVFRLYFSWTRGKLSETLKVLLQPLIFFCYYKYTKNGFICYHLPCSLKIILNVFAFLNVKANSKEIWKKHPFVLFSEKCWCQHFCWDSRLIILKNVWLPQCFFVDSNSPCKDLLFPCGPNLAQKPLYLVGTVLNVF